MTAMFFRVHEDVSNRDLSAGELYDSGFNPATLEDVQRAGTDVLISPMTPDSFELLAAAHDMGTDININVVGTDTDMNVDLGESDQD